MVKERTEFGPSTEDASKGDSVDRVRGDRSTIVANANAARNPETETKGAGAVHPSRSGAATNDWGFDALRVAKDAYADGKSFADSSLRRRWEAAERSFGNRHPSGSKYYSDTYRHKSRLFRPKTRAAIRQGEAQAAASFFANDDVARVGPADPDNEMQAAGAAVLHEALKLRLATPNHRVAIPWFLTLVGAYQDSEKNGIVVSKQWWEYKAVANDVETPLIDQTTGEPLVDEDGRPRFRRTQEMQVVADRPHCDILAPENVLIDRGSSWIDPIGTSPFVVIMHPMYIDEVESRMENPDPKTGQPPWIKIDRTMLKTASTWHATDSTRQEREGHREDSKESQIAIEEYTVVWIHENFIRWQDEDFVYWTVGDRHLLSDPVPVREVYPHCEEGERPIVMGQSVIETNRLYPSGKSELTAGLQQEANEIVNQRLDNVKLALNKRYLVKRGTQTDLRSILRNTAGSVTLTNNPKEDVEVLETRDVTSSSYQEQDRINADFDEIAGSFSVGSVATNRRMGETVGGMGLISGAANMLGELDLRVFTETWVQPVLSQIVRMLQHFETDKNILEVAGRRSELWQKYRRRTIDDELLMQDVLVNVDVGIGATDPMQRLQKFQMAAKVLGEIFGESIAPHMKAEEITKEVFSTLGFRDGRRFVDFDEATPQVTMLQQKIDELQKKVETKELDRQSRVDTATIAGLTRVIAQSIDSEQRAEQHAEKGARDMKAEMDRAGIDRQDRVEDRQMKREDHDLDTQSKVLDVFHQHAMGQIKVDAAKEMARIKEAQARDNGEGNGAAPPARPDSGPPLAQSSGPDPMEEIARTLLMQTEAMREMAQSVGDAVDSLNTPKMIVHDQRGRPVGVRSGGPNA